MRRLYVLVGVALTALLAISSNAAAQSTTCNTRLTGQTISGNLVVPDDGVCVLNSSSVSGNVDVGENAFFQATGSRIGGRVESNRSLTTFIDTGTTVGGRVEANRTDKVFVFNSTIGGTIDVWKTAERVNICGNTVDGGIHVQKSGTDILIGDPLAAGCGPNTVRNGSKVSVHDNFTDVEFVIRGNTVQGGDMLVFDNKGPVEKFVQDNKGGDDLDCFGNEKPFTASGNTGWKEQRNQCAIPPQECNTTLTGANIPGDLVVPDDGVCILINSTVGGNVKVGENAYFQATGSKLGGDVRSKRSQTLFIDTGTTVAGDVEAGRSAQVFVFNSTLNGRLDVYRSTEKVHVCGNTIDGSVKVRDSGPDILIGDPLAVGCAGNTVRNGHNVTVEDNETDVEFVIRGNKVQGGDLRVNDNRGPVEKFVQDNVGGDELSCYGNEEPFTATGNTGWHRLRGQCAVPATVCNTTLTGQTIPGALVVPEDGVCVLVNSTVGGDVNVGKNAFLETRGSKIGDDVYGDQSQTLFIDTGTTIADDIHAWGTAQVFVFNSGVGDRVEVHGSDDKVQLCGNTIDGRVDVTDNQRDILIGDPQALDCAGNTIRNGSSMNVSDNTVDVELTIKGNTFLGGGDLRVRDNSGAAPKSVQNNTGGDDLVCTGNDQPFDGSPNPGWNDIVGQCA